MNGQQVLEWGKRLFDSMGTTTKKAIAAVIGIAMVVTAALAAMPARADENMIADPTTFTQWESGIGDPTDPRSTGRVWTDKSVSTQAVTLKTYDDKEVTVTPQDGSFLVGLSAMSSAQKLIGVSNVTKPLDIVLVLDTSGSMAFDMDGNDQYVYEPVYQSSLDHSSTYYIRSGSNYRTVQWDNNRQEWGYTTGWGAWSQWYSFTPKTSETDADTEHTQFYSRRTITTEETRMYALKQAVNGFIDQTIAANKNVSDDNKKNRIGLVTYAAGSNQRSGLTANLEGLKTTVNGLTANGATRADLGLATANTVLGQARADASKIVIFFTDGQPTSSNGFENGVADDAIGNAKTMKDAGATVYSVGIFQGADPNAAVSNVTNNSDIVLKSNAFMQGVSSNYPNATGFTTANLGTRAANGNYYLAASDADALNTVFDTIWGEVSSNPTSPIQSTTQGGTTDGQGNGVVTFTDQLGDYMRVTKMNSIVFAGKQYETVSATTSADGSQTVYTFEGSVTANEIYQAADLSTMQIVVKHGEGRTGDLVTVHVPAELLPLRLYTANVDRDGNVTTSINRTNPMRLFYEVALKDDTVSKIAQPDKAMAAYIAGNTDADGNVRFHTNAYDEAADGANGSTTAVFTPATTNDFYYFTQDTPLYNSKDLDDPATSIDTRGTYYYLRTFYANNAKHEQWIDVFGKNAIGKAVKDADGHYYAPAGTTRTGLSSLYTAAKESNPTETATNAIAPHWEMNTVTVNLGNNGLQKIALPGTLVVTEHVAWPAGATKDPDKTFPFTLELSGTGADGEYQATIAGQQVTVKNGSTFELKDGETATVYGLPAGAKATVTQTGDHGGAGWSVDHDSASGDIERSETTELGFVNTYALDPTTLDAGSIKGSKTLAGRDWQPDESFTFQIAAGYANPDAPLPDPTTVAVTNPGGTDAYKDGQTIPFEFGAIDYTAPGTYLYVITEAAGTKPGMSYSGARYIVNVAVTDNGDGTMTATPTMMNTFGDDGIHIDAEPTVQSADFTNTFLGANSAVATIRGIKNYTDHTGTNPNDEVGKFNVVIEADKDNPANGPTFTNNVRVGVDGTWARELQFTNDALNGQTSQTFTYHVREVVPDGVDADDPTQRGMTYDVNTYDVQVVVSRDDAGDLIAAVTYPDGADRVELTNSYRAANTDGTDLQVAKKVTGRSAQQDQFSFNARLTAGDAGSVKIKQDDGTLADWTDDRTATSPALDKDQTGTVDFGDIVFTMPGTYTFQVSEQLPDGVAAANPTKDGWTYDTHTHTVTYTVTDNNGQLEPKRDADGNDLFTNDYKASVSYDANGELRIGKTLNGRAMNPEEFTFAITPVDGAPMPNGAASLTTKNPFASLDGRELIWPVPGTLMSDLVFTQDDAGKTYEYKIREVVPDGVTEDAPTKDGVTYDFTDHTVAIGVIDNGDGTMRTETTIDGAAGTVARFVNKYAIADGHSAIGFAKTIAGRDWQDGESFTFELTANTDQSSVPEDVLTKAMPEQTSVTVTKPADGNTAAFRFNGFTFTQSGTYAYDVREQNAGASADGLTNDARAATASFTVMDNGDGQYSIGRLITGIDFENGVSTFTNTYTTQPFDGVPDGMEFSKQLTGVEWTADREFEFTLTGNDGAPMPDGAKDGVLTKSVGKPDSGDTAKFDFGAIKYEEPGVYEYTVTETKGDMPGVSYDGRTATVKVTVSDDGKGRLVATAEVSDGAFENTYEAADFNDLPAGMVFSKQLTGIDWPEDREFEFTLEAKTADAPMPADATVSVGKPADGDTATFDFGAIRYAKPGVYEYTVTETKGDMPGVSYDGHAAVVKVTVSDDGKGQLVAVADVADGAFVNVYGAKPSGDVPEGMTFIKQLTGVDWPADREFEFMLEAQDDAPMPDGAKDGKLTVQVGKPADGATQVFDFGAITYTAEGTYQYTVSEVAGDMPGVEYATNKATVTVTVTDDKQGNLIAKASVDGNVFTNAYTAQPVSVGSADLKLSKQLTGVDWPADREFEFTLEAKTADAPMPADATVSVAKPANGSDTASFGFGEIVYTEPGVYEYAITETKGDMPGVAYDGHEAKVTVVVTDNHAGQLEAKVTTAEGKFTNVYTAQPVSVGSADLKLSKQLTGIAWPEDREFGFTLEAKTADAPMPAKTTVSVGKPANGDTASFGFGTITYDKPGVYKYAITETKGDMPGVAYDDHTAKVTVEVADNHAGQLEAKVTTAEGKFVNAYTAQPFDGVPAGMEAAFSKRLTGIAWPQGREFEFTIEAAEGTPMPKDASVSVGKPADGDTVSFDFGAIRYEESGVYEYTVKETKGDMPGVSYDSHVAAVTVTVRDDGKGRLVAEAAVTDATFTNSYQADQVTVGSADLKLSKQLTGIAWPEDHEFGFTLEAVTKDAPMPADAKTTVGRPANGTDTASFGFGEIVYTEPGVYEYMVTETKGDMPGVAYDAHSANVTVTVKDNHAGQLTADVTTTKGAFVNAYTAQESTGVPTGMTFTKQLTGTAWTQDRRFTFVLTGEDDAPMPQGATDGVLTKTIGKPDQGDAATFDFGDITYTKSGTYTYTVKELAGVMPGVEFDDHTARVTVTVKDDQQGHLVATADVDKPDFVNDYAAKEFNGVPAQMKFSKRLAGTEWADRVFTFVLEGVDGAPMPTEHTVTVGAPEQGDTADFAFGAIRYTKTGTYQYRVTERNDGMSGITYDDRTATVSVEVRDNGLGQLVATATVSDGAFENTYEAADFNDLPAGMVFSKQLIGIDWPQDREFGFTLEAKTADAPMPAKTTVSVGKPADGDTATFDFGAIRYEQPGVYEYTVTEAKGDMPGVAYDGHAAVVKVTVSDDHAGQLVAVAEVSDGAFTNSYSAGPSSDVPEGMTFIKQLSGIAWSEDREFEFTLEAAEGTPMPAKTTVSVGKPADGDTATFDFGAISYDKPGVYEYTVKETKGDMPGVEYDGHVAKVTVTVSDNKQGNLIAKASVDGNVFTNAYTAQPFDGVPAGMEAAFSKRLTGIAWPEDREFGFTLDAAEGTPMPAKTSVSVGKPADGDTVSFDFGAIRYEEPGVYEYTVRETKGDMPGVSYDGHTAKVTVTVRDDGNGRLVAEAAVTDATFTNSYAAQPFDGVPTGMEAAFSKQLTGIAWPEDREFEFTIEAAEGTPMPAKTTVSVGKPADGDTASFDFGATRYEQPGTYEYTVKETRGTMPGVAYDYHEAHIVVTVTDDGSGKLKAEAKVADGAFVNKYSAAPTSGVPTDFRLGKRVEGMTWSENQRFEFTIQGQDGAPMPARTTVSVGKPADGDSATFDFGEIVFERSGVYRYTVTETAGDQPGMVYDGHTATVTVDVADDGEGHLVTATTVENGLFTNRYSTSSVAYPGVDVTEDLTGRAQEQGEFQLTVTGSEEDMRRAGYAAQTNSYEFDAAASGETVTVPGLFTGLELTHDDIRAGTKFTYEIDQTGARSGNGLTVDDHVYRVQIWATDNGDGTMQVHTSVDGAETSEKTPTLPFHNVYATTPVTIGGDASVRINAHKTLHGRDLVAGEFRFAVRDAKGAQLAGGTNAADGTVNFDAIEFTDARLNADVASGIATASVDGKQTVYRYAATVDEIADALPAGVTVLEGGFAVALVITDNGDGQLSAKVEYPSDANGALGFVNQYGAASEVGLGMNGTKVLAVASGDNPPDITGKYTFTIAGSEGAPMPERTTATNDAAGSVDFGTVTYTVANVFGEEPKPADDAEDDADVDAKADADADADAQSGAPASDDADAESDAGVDADADADDAQPATREKTFTYTVTEAGAVAGVTNDASAQRTISVHVVDNGDGTLTVDKQPASAGVDFTFTNTYAVQPTDPTSPTDTKVQGGVPLTKTLDGRPMRAGEFTFEFVEATSGDVVGTAVNAADGTVVLPQVVFDAPGNHAYLIREVAGDAGGVTYDNRTYAAVAKVVDNGDGTLGVSWNVTDAAGATVDAMTFENVYAAQPTSVQISAGKMLLGRELKDGEFSFVLQGLDSAPMPQTAKDGVQTVVNDADGNAQFGVIEYTQPGDYLYTVSEVKGDAEGVTYDTTEHRVSVHVVDDGDGALQADLQYADGAEGIVFHNTYVKPQEPDQPDQPTPTPSPSNPTTPSPSTPTTPVTPPSTGGHYYGGTSSTPTRYVGSVASTGSSIALIVAAVAVLLFAGVGLLLALRRRER